MWKSYLQSVLQTAFRMDRKPFPVGVLVTSNYVSSDTRHFMHLVQCATIFDHFPDMSFRLYAPMDAIPDEYKYRPENSGRDFMASLDVCIADRHKGPNIILIFTAYPKRVEKPIWMSMEHRSMVSLDLEIEWAFRESKVEDYQASWFRMLSQTEKLDQGNLPTHLQAYGPQPEEIPERADQHRPKHRIPYPYDRRRKERGDRQLSFQRRESRPTLLADQAGRGGLLRVDRLQGRRFAYHRRDVLLTFESTAGWVAFGLLRQHQPCQEDLTCKFTIALLMK